MSGSNSIFYETFDLGFYECNQGFERESGDYNPRMAMRHGKQTSTQRRILASQNNTDNEIKLN